jgi:hypothetical protein
MRTWDTFVLALTVSTLAIGAVYITIIAPDTLPNVDIAMIVFGGTASTAWAWHLWSIGCLRETVARKTSSIEARLAQQEAQIAELREELQFEAALKKANLRRIK